MIQANRSKVGFALFNSRLRGLTSQLLSSFASLGSYLSLNLFSQLRFQMLKTSVLNSIKPLQI